MKSKIIKVLVVFSLLLFWLPSTASQAKEKPILGVSTVYEKSIKTVDLAVYVQSDEKIAGGSFDITYDSSLLTVYDSSVAVGDALSGFMMNSKNGATGGKVSVAFANDTGLMVNGTVLAFKGRISKAGSTINLDFDNVQFYGEDGKKIEVTIVDGAIKPFGGKETIHGEKVNSSKPWTIELSTAYNRASLNEHTVSVKNSSGKLVDIVIMKVSNTKFTVKPKGNYARGTYTLEITEQLLSASGEKLKEPVQYSFTVQ